MKTCLCAERKKLRARVYALGERGVTEPLALWADPSLLCPHDRDKAGEHRPCGEGGCVGLRDPETRQRLVALRNLLFIKEI